MTPEQIKQKMEEAAINHRDTFGSIGSYREREFAKVGVHIALDLLTKEVIGPLAEAMKFAVMCSDIFDQAPPNIREAVTLSREWLNQVPVKYPSSTPVSDSTDRGKDGVCETCGGTGQVIYDGDRLHPKPCPRCKGGKE
jgi:hypothetical protein